MLNSKIQTLLYSLTVIILLAFIYLNSKNPDNAALLLIPLGICFGGFFLSYFYRIWRNEKEKVNYTFIRSLTNEEKEPLLKEIQKYKNTLRNTFISLFLTITSVFLFIFLVNEQQYHNAFGAVIGWLSMFIIIISLVWFVWSVSRIDRSNSLERDLKEGVVKIEGNLFKTDLQFGKEGSIKSLRMGHYDFDIEGDRRLETIYNSLIDNTKYSIELSPGTKKIWQITSLN